MEWTTACPDWQARIVARQSLIPVGPLFPEEAAAALRVFDALKIVDAPGSPTMGEVARPWVRDFVASVFGAYDPETGRRLISEFFLLISKKNAKSTTAAGIMMTALVLNWRQSGEFGILAPTVEVANNAFAPARDMVRQDEELSKLFHVQEHIKTITHRVTGASLKVVAADSETVGGKKWIGTLIDELWLFGKKPGAEDMLREAIGGLASRPEGFVIYTTTQSNEPPAGVFRQRLHYARKVRDGEIADRKFLPILYEFPPDMVASGAARQPDNAYITNPNLGASVDEEFLRRELGKAEEAGEDSLRGFLAKHLNIEIGLSLRTDNWPGAEFWERNADPSITLDALLERCDVIEVGIDGGGLDDLLGFCALGRDRESGNWLAWCRAWAHEIVLERRKSEAARLRDFEAAGHLTIVKAPGQDVDEVCDIVQRIDSAGLLDKVGVDPAGIGAVLDELEARGIAKDRVVGISQGWRMAGAIKTAERRVAEGALKHDGSPLMAWCVGNARIEPRANAVMITKQASGFAKIDPLMALFDAVELMSRAPQSASPENYFAFIAAQGAATAQEATA